MNTEQTSKNIFMYIKTHYGETILAKIRKLERSIFHKHANHITYKDHM